MEYMTPSTNPAIAIPLLGPGNPSLDSFAALRNADREIAIVARVITPNQM